MNCVDIKMETETADGEEPIIFFDQPEKQRCHIDIMHVKKETETTIKEELFEGQSENQKSHINSSGEKHDYSDSASIFQTAKTECVSPQRETCSEPIVTAKSDGDTFKRAIAFNNVSAFDLDWAADFIIGKQNENESVVTEPNTCVNDAVKQLQSAATNKIVSNRNIRSKGNMCAQTLIQDKCKALRYHCDICKARCKSYASLRCHKYCYHKTPFHDVNSVEAAVPIMLNAKPTLGLDSESKYKFHSRAFTRKCPVEKPATENVVEEPNICVNDAVKQVQSEAANTIVSNRSETVECSLRSKCNMYTQTPTQDNFQCDICNVHCKTYVRLQCHEYFYHKIPIHNINSVDAAMPRILTTKPNTALETMLDSTSKHTFHSRDFTLKCPIETHAAGSVVKIGADTDYFQNDNRMQVDIEFQNTVKDRSDPSDVNEIIGNAIVSTKPVVSIDCVKIEAETDDYQSIDDFQMKDEFQDPAVLIESISFDLPADLEPLNKHANHYSIKEIAENVNASIRPTLSTESFVKIKSSTDIFQNVDGVQIKNEFKNPAGLIKTGTSVRLAGLDVVNEQYDRANLKTFVETVNGSTNSSLSAEGVVRIKSSTDNLQNIDETQIKDELKKYPVLTKCLNAYEPLAEFTIFNKHTDKPVVEEIVESDHDSTKPMASAAGVFKLESSMDGFQNVDGVQKKDEFQKHAVLTKTAVFEPLIGLENILKKNAYHSGIKENEEHVNESNKPKLFVTVVLTENQFIAEEHNYCTRNIPSVSTQIGPRPITYYCKLCNFNCLSSESLTCHHKTHHEVISSKAITER